MLRHLRPSRRIPTRARCSPPCRRSAASPARPLPAPFPIPPAARSRCPQDTVRAGAAAGARASRDLVTRFDVHARRCSGALSRGSTPSSTSASTSRRGDAGAGRRVRLRQVDHRAQLIRLVQPDPRQHPFDGIDIDPPAGGRESEAAPRASSMFFQDPFASLDPRLTVGFSIAEPITTHRLASGSGGEAAGADTAAARRPAARACGRYPHEFSGGQRQRIASRGRWRISRG